MTRAAVLGAGSWGTAFAQVLADAGTEVTVWGRRPEVVRSIEEDHANPGYLPDHQLPESVRATTDVAAACEGADLVVLGIHSQTLRDSLTGWGAVLGSEATVVSLMKGIELGTGQRMSQVIAETAGIDPARVAVVSGPNLAREIAERQPSASVVACADSARADAVAEACDARYFRPYTSADVVGVEIGGAVKNVVALAVGMARGMGLGDNTSAMLITRGLAEITRLGSALGADPTTFLGLAGAGDLVATCSSTLSRNHSVGLRLGRGEPVEEILASQNQVAEGVTSCRSILALAQQHQIPMPIAAAVVGVVHEGVSVEATAERLMSRVRKAEQY
ncbi:glycerol-3-phosphate dehydrogenase (NAD(P)+) [Kytococcus aerolatus]|uniref:Glycerol-3-phosphate dehydrogenase [NAD(P)+] n=1 Tax=Kytococcus aerolatus TaxID=592308 RepID=A0A212U1K0_9MICO|nr:NAD(P)H-dependent glycerol-3-phosphate dehydrogenase [Kytococcus aerolatus]SNC72113.1 glycerol-3-phosphate dehydrogenase (NAD(P)+) [Kytococcus aerolatus]